MYTVYLYICCIYSKTYKFILYISDLIVQKNPNMKNKQYSSYKLLLQNKKKKIK